MIAAFKERLQSKIAEDRHFAELIKGSGIAFVLRIVGIVAGYIFTLLVTRTLGAKAWGTFALCLVVLQIASVIGRLGMDTALLRFTAEYTAKGDINTLKEIYKKALTLVVPFSILVAISVYFLSPILANKVFHKPYLTNYFHIVSFIVVPFVLLWIHSESIRGLKKIKEYMLLQQSGIFLIAVVLFLIGTPFVKSNFLPILSYGVSIFALATGSIYLWRKYLTNLFINFKTSSLSTLSYQFLLSISIPMLLSSSLSLIMGWTDTIMLGMFRSTQEVGVYNVALRVSMITSITLMAINTIAAPKFAEFWGKGDIKGLAKVAQQSTKLIFWSSFPMLLLFLFFSRPILGMFGAEFQAGSIVLMILSFGQLFHSISGNNGTLLYMTNRHFIDQYINVFCLVLNIFVNSILIPLYGIVGAAIATFTTVVIKNLVINFYIKREFNFMMLYIPTINMRRRNG